MIELLATDVFLNPILVELEKQPEAWKDRTAPQSTISAERDTQTIFLRSVKRPIPPGISSNDVLASELTSQSHLFPNAYRLARRIAIVMGGTLGRVMTIRVKPRGRVYRQRSSGKYYASHCRYHVLLSPDASGKLISGSVSEQVHAGEIWRCDLLEDYELVNNGDTWLVYLAIDLHRNTQRSTPAPDRVGELLSLSPIRFLFARIARIRWGRREHTPPAGPHAKQTRKAVADCETVPELGPLLRSMYRKGTKETSADAASALKAVSGPVYVALRSKGRMRSEAWSNAENHYSSAKQAIRTARGRLNTAQTARVDVMEIWFGQLTREIDLSDEKAVKAADANTNRGVIGFELVHKDSGKVLTRISPTTVIATNRKLAGWLESLSREEPGHAGRDARLRLFRGGQYLLSLTGKREAHRLHRGAVRVDLAQVNFDSVSKLEKLLGDYLINSAGPDGRMRYMYYPSRGEEPDGRNNMIRQWMATVALIRLGKYRKDGALHDLAAKNIKYNLDHYYSEDKGRGIIDEHGKVKLGAVALAALAIDEHPDSSSWSRQQQALLKTVDYLWRRNGSFHTLYRPRNRKVGQNFYPGEALLLWSAKYAADKDPILLKRFMKSQRYYRTWHLKHRNPAFVPWHTQAYYRLWQSNGDARLAEWIFEMNDWLVPVQQWSDAPSPEMRGRFYDPHRPFGPPHASSTGVYLEGLIDAFALARSVSDTQRQERYRQTINRGLRSVIQLTFKNDIDMFYVSKRDTLRGGVRTTVYNNVVRVDNVQHNLMAIMKILSNFRETDYAGAAPQPKPG